MFPSVPTGIVPREAWLRQAMCFLNNRQRWYGYRLLTASVTQPTCDLLPATLRGGDEQAQLGDQPEGNNQWAQLGGRKPKRFEQKLARVLTEGTDVWADTDIENTAWVEREKFLGKISALPSKDAKKMAEEAMWHTDGQLAVSMWFNRSRLESERKETKLV